MTDPVPASHQGRMFDTADDPFWHYGVGAMCWFRVHGHRAIYVLCPGPEPDPVLLYVDHQDDNWAAEGKVHGWDGNILQPTFHPSIETPYWHGYIRGGNLVTA